MKQKVLVTRDVFDEVIAYLLNHFDVIANPEDDVWDQETIAGKLADCDGVMTSLTDRVDAELLAHAPRLKAVSNIAVGYNNIDIAACTVRRIMVTNTPGVLTESTADFAWALLLAAARRVTEAEAYLRRGEWTRWQLKQFLGVDVHGANLGILGMGRIGQAIARRARGFNMTIRYHNRGRLPPDTEQAIGAAYDERDALLEWADYLNLSVPYSRETHHLIGREELWKMKSSAILVNIARGGVVDEKALLDALNAGKVRAAALDVYDKEPPEDFGLIDHPNVIPIPHLGAAAVEGQQRAGLEAVRILKEKLS